jgi:sugar transferase (PEP-CTERM/EpsH1 system associated)
LRILWLKTELLHPVDKGGKIRTYNMLRALKSTHRITYLTLVDDEAGPAEREAASEYCHELVCVPHRTRPKFSAGFYAELASNLISPLPYFMKKYESPALRHKINSLSSRGNFDILVCDFLQPSINVPEHPSLPTVLFQHNVEAMIWRRHYEVQKNPIKKAYLYNQWRKSFAYESATCQRFDQVVAVSTEDAQTMRHEYNLQQVADVPTGVDTCFFRPQGDEPNLPHNLVFTGSMDWLPNEDAMQYFIKEILPRIRQSLPDVTLTVVGREPYSSLIDQARHDPAIVVTGRVDDVRPYIERATAYIVPIRIGGGTRLKIYEAMAMEKPIVSTSVGAEGLPLRNGVELLIADTAEAFADAVIRVLKDEDLAQALGRRAATTVRQKYSWAVAATTFAEVCERTVARNRHLNLNEQVRRTLTCASDLE